LSVDVALLFPYFNEEKDASIFRYPPLGLGYLASVLRNAGISVELIDATFSRREDVLSKIRRLSPRILGIYSMVTINHHAVQIAEELRDHVELLVAGGPLPSLTPEVFLDTFDVVVRHEGEEAFLELVKSYLDNRHWNGTKGIVYKNTGGSVQATEQRSFVHDLDSLPFPSRDMFPNHAYQKYWRKHHGYTATSQITTRGCPYLCDFCSNPVFGRSYRERSPRNVFNEMLEIKKLGYDRVFFTDDCFTQNPRRVEELCDLIISEHFEMEWMCLSRADRLGRRLANKMSRAGCVQIFFGIESGDDRMLRIMNKHIDLNDVQKSVAIAKAAGIQTGGFFILGYPGETNESLRETIRFSSGLPLDYLSYSFPYPIVGTGLHTKVRERINRPEWRKQRGQANRHQLLFHGDFSQTKLRFAKRKGGIQHTLRQNGSFGHAAAHVFERITDPVISILR
jgi:anaerobic magnesium-protoporphyrin IX monomethyl ester cyclase